MWDLTWLRATLSAVPDERFPLIDRILQIIQIEGHQVIEKESFNLATEDIDL